MSAESTSFIIDVSKRMIGDGHVSKIIAYLEYTLLDKCRRRRKTDWISCYLANCEITKNSQSIPDVFQVQSFLAPVTSMETIRILKELQSYCNDITQRTVKEENDHEEVSNQTQSMVQSLLVASLDIREEFNKRKLEKQIMIFTDDMDGLDLSSDEIDVLTEELNSTLILIDCRKTKSPDDNNEIFKTKWGQLLKAMPGSMVYKMNDLLIEITSPKPKPVKPVRIFSGELRLGSEISRLIVTSNEKLVKPEDDSSSISIKVEGFPATKPLSSLNRKNVVKSEHNGKTSYDSVKAVIEYEIRDDDGKFVSVSPQSIAKAYRYGSDYVVLPSSLDEQRFYKTLPGIDIRGFLDRKRLQRYYLNSESKFIIADTRLGSIADIVSLNALVDVMLECDKVAIVRYVAKCNAEVQMCMLCPLHIKKQQEEGDEIIRTFILNRLPFAEDERVSDFPRLTNRTTTSGRKLENDDDDQKNDKIDLLMSEYIDSLDMDKVTSSIPDDEYYKTIDTTSAKSTTLPLPDNDKDRKKVEEHDPLRIPAIHIHRQQQVLLEWIHQHLIYQTEEFQVPEMPDILKDKITPHFVSKRNVKKLSELIQLLDIKRIDKKQNSGDEQYDSEEDEAIENIPTLKSLLALGERKE